MQQIGGHHLIFRLCWVYGARGQNFMLTMMRLAREREKLRVVRDQIGCPTWSRMIARDHRAGRSGRCSPARPAPFKGIYHLCGFRPDHLAWLC